jgi:hypothetical protein
VATEKSIVRVICSWVEAESRGFRGGSAFEQPSSGKVESVSSFFGHLQPIHDSILFHDIGDDPIFSSVLSEKAMRVDAQAPR